MRNFFLNLFYFILLPTILFVVTEISISLLKDKILSEQNLELLFKQEALEYGWIKDIKSDSLAFLAGSSSIKYGLSCSILNGLSNKKIKYINIADIKRDPIQTYFILKNIEITRVSSIYFGLDPWIYSKRYYKFKNNYLYLDFSPIEILLYSLEHDNNALTERYKCFLSYLFPKAINNNQSKIMDIPLDFGSVALTVKPKNFNEPIDSWFQLEKYGWSELQFNYLKKLSELCKERGIKFYVFVPPKKSTFNEVYKAKCKTIHEQYVSNILSRGFNVPIFGKFDEFGDTEGNKLFSDAFHLNDKGQKAYSNIFYQLSQQQMSIFSKSYLWFKSNHINENDLMNKVN
jgi:hypothetical protein